MEDILLVPGEVFIAYKTLVEEFAAHKRECPALQSPAQACFCGLDAAREQLQRLSGTVKVMRPEGSAASN